MSHISSNRPVASAWRVLQWRSQRCSTSLGLGALAVFFALVALAPAAPAPKTNAEAKATSDDANVIARVGDSELKMDELRGVIDHLAPKDQAAIARDPSLLTQIVRSILVQRVVLKEALAKHWDQDPAVAAQLQRVHDSTLTETYLASVSKPAPGYPSDTDLQTAYDTNKSKLLVPRQFQLAQIFIALPKSPNKADTDKAQVRLDAVRKSLHQHDADFAAIARSASDEQQSARRGGEIGWLTEAQMQPEIRPQVIALGKNAVSEPVRLDDGWHILKVLDIKEAYTPTLAQVHDQLAQQLRNERARANSQAYIAKLLEQNPVAINELALSKLVGKSK